MCQFVRSHAGTGMTSDLKTYPTMNRFILYAGLLAAAVTATGCRQAPTGNTDGDGTISPSFVQQYYDLSAIAVRQYFDYPYIQIMPETYETCSYSVPPSVRFKALSEKSVSYTHLPSRTHHRRGTASSGHSLRRPSRTGRAKVKTNVS